MHEKAISEERLESCLYDGDRLLGFGFCLGPEWRDFVSDQMQFAPIQQFPLDFFAWFQADGRGQRQRKIDVETGLLFAGTNGLNFQWIECGHFII